MQMVKTVNVILARNSVLNFPYIWPNLGPTGLPSSVVDGKQLKTSLTLECGKKSIWYQFDKFGFIYPVMSS